MTTPIRPHGPSETTGRSVGSGRALRRRLRLAGVRLQRRVAAALGVSAGHRSDTVVAMLVSNARRAPGYWLQLLLAMGIATLGLVLGSTAVVIGAMLVSPLMGPIIELGMGFAVGSTLLVIRATLRVGLSVLSVVAGAALITLLLPFHEVTTEIAARTTPTALDLLVAVFCALTAAYTTVRATSDTTAAAAGTAIGIALVPPLCVVGYGLGTASAPIAAGAGLLFTANFSAIVVFSVAAFLLLGYARVDADRLERDHLGDGRTVAERVAERVDRALGRVLGARYGRTMRLVAPALFLVVVYVPLGRALDQVAWQVRVRSAIRHVLAQEAPDAVQTSVTVEAGTVALRLLVLGSTDDAARLERTLVRRIVAAAGVPAPEVTVTAVPDAAALAAAIARRRREPAPAPAPALPALRARLDTVLASRWPVAVAGPLVGWDATFPDTGAAAVTVRHLGAPAGAAADALLAGELAAAVGAPVRLTSVALPSRATTAPPNATRARERAWLDSARAALELAGPVSAVVACVGIPRPGRSAAVRRRHAAVQAALDSTAVARAGRLFADTAPGWSLRLAVGACRASAGNGAVPSGPRTESAVGAGARRPP